MPDWKRILVGDDAELPSRDLNYYRDLLLVSPFFLFTLGGLVHLLGAQNEKAIAWKCLTLAAVSIVLASERLILFISAAGLCCLRLMFALAMSRDGLTLLTLLASIIPILLTLRFVRDYKPGYTLPAKLDVISFVLIATSFLISLRLVILFDSTPI